MIAMIRNVARIFCAMFLAWTSSHFAFAQEPAAANDATPAVATEEKAGVPDEVTNTTMIIVVGAIGEDEFGEQFEQSAAAWKAIAEQQKWRVVTIGLKRTTAADEPQESTESANTLADRERLQRAIGQCAQTAAGRLWLVMIGHGTAAGKTAKFNLVGPDVDSATLKAWLAEVKQETIVCDCASANAPFLVELSAPNRIIVSATKSGAEINFARFGRFLSEAIGNPAADLDHDSEVSLLEAFLKASKDTEQFYRENSRLATEHALIEDNADRVGTPASFYVGAIPVGKAKEGHAVDGRRSGRIILWTAPDSTPLSTEQMAARTEIELAIDQLREQKKKLGEEEYYQQLEQLLVKLAEIYDAAESSR